MHAHLQAPSHFSAIRGIFVLVLALCAPAALASPDAIGAPDLQHAIRDRIDRVEEFRFIRQAARELGIRVWLFGGTAAGFGHYVTGDLKRERGDPRFQPERFDYDYTNIFRSTQDLDIVVDGTPEQAARLQQALEKTYPHLQGSKTAWEVRLLRQATGDKQALLDNPDFLQQNTDSNSTGMIELSELPAHETAVVRDLRDWTNATDPEFLRDLRLGKLHYYFSETHAETSRAKQGLNPPIISVIRYLTKAFQYELGIQSEDRARIKTIIDAWDPASPHGDYVQKWIEKNGRKLFQHAVNMEYAWDQLEVLGLRGKLLRFGAADPAAIDSLAWWMNKEPLRTHPLGRAAPERPLPVPPGLTARELKLTELAHETGNYLAYESITKAHTGDPNVFVSRDQTTGEAAMYGQGFYTQTGRSGARGTGFTIRFQLRPEAREGVDFYRAPDKPEYIVVTNRAAIRVIPESLSLTPHGYFELLVRADGFDSADRGILERLRRRVHAKLGVLSPDELTRIAAMIEPTLQIGPPAPFNLGELSKMVNAGSPPSRTQLQAFFRKARRTTGEPDPAAAEWFRLPQATAHPELLIQWMQTGREATEWLASKILSLPHWQSAPLSAEFILALGKNPSPSVIQYLSRRLTDPNFRAAHPEITPAFEIALTSQATSSTLVELIERHPSSPALHSWAKRILLHGSDKDRENLFKGEYFHQNKGPETKDMLRLFVESEISSWHLMAFLQNYFWNFSDRSAEYSALANVMMFSSPEARRKRLLHTYPNHPDRHELYDPAACLRRRLGSR